MADRRDEDPMDALLSDLERQAEGLHLADREIEVAELATAQYAEVTLAARLHAAVGAPLRVRLAGDESVLEGTVEDAGLGWFALARAATTWIVATGGVVELIGLVDAAVPDTARPAVSRLSIRAALRAHAGESPVVLRLTTGAVREGRLVRVGADFVELRPEASPVVVLPLAAIAAVGVRS